MRTWDLLSLVAVALACLHKAWAVPGERSKAMGNLYWCTTLCMCRTGTKVQVQCFHRNQIYELMDVHKNHVMKMERAQWLLEDQVHWCNDLCLCHTKNNVTFKCAQEEMLDSFITSVVDSSLLYHEHPTTEIVLEDNIRAEEEQEEEEEVAAAEVEHNRRAEERKKNRRHKKNKKRVKEEEEEELAEPFDNPHPVQIQEEGEHEPATTTAATLALDDEVSSSETHESEAELLPKQEAVAASPAVTARQPPTRRQPFPPTSPSTHTSHASTREDDSPAPETSAVREVPVERKTVASEVSQDLDELGSTVRQIKHDVVLNQRILLVTVAVAGIAMLGVLVLAVHSCARRRQMSSETKPSREPAKDDHHVTKINREEEW